LYTPGAWKKRAGGTNGAELQIQWASARATRLDQLRNDGNPSETDDDETLPVMCTDAAPPRQGRRVSTGKISGFSHRSGGWTYSTTTVTLAGN